MLCTVAYTKSIMLAGRFLAGELHLQKAAKYATAPIVLFNGVNRSIFSSRVRVG
jgi:hypothetical protein